MPVLFFMCKLPPTSRAEPHRHTVEFFLILWLMRPSEDPKDILVCFGDSFAYLAHGQSPLSMLIGVPTVPTLPELSVGRKNSPGIGNINRNIR